MQFRTQMIGLAAAAALAGTAAAVMGPNNPEGAPGSAKNRPGSNTPAPGGGNCTLRAASDAMGIDWMTKGEINEAIPPTYTEFLGLALMAHIASQRQAA